MQSKSTVIPRRAVYVVPTQTAVIAPRPQPIVRPVVEARAPFYQHSTVAGAFYGAGKRSIDVTVALALIVASLPVMFAIAVVIKATSRGPILFRHRRLGIRGEEFDCLKFRTMVEDAEQLLERDRRLRRRFTETFKIDDDPRVTTIGRFLRRMSLDELPQLFNVLGGTMSLVGPRPIVKKELEKYSIYSVKLLSVKPGLGGLWQTLGRSDTTYPQRVLLDMYYIDNRSLALDLKLLLLTAAVVLSGTGAR